MLGRTVLPLLQRQRVRLRPFDRRDPAALPCGRNPAAVNALRRCPCSCSPCGTAGGAFAAINALRPSTLRPLNAFYRGQVRAATFGPIGAEQELDGTDHQAPDDAEEDAEEDLSPGVWGHYQCKLLAVPVTTRRRLSRSRRAGDGGLGGGRDHRPAGQPGKRRLGPGRRCPFRRPLADQPQLPFANAVR